MNVRAPQTLFDFSSPNNYETDYWDMQTQTIAGKYDNGVGTATLDNVGGLPNEAVSGVLNSSVQPYNSWLSDTISDQIVASNSSAGDSNNEDLSIRAVVQKATPVASGAETILGKLTNASGAGWLLYFQAGGSINLFVSDGTVTKNLLIVANVDDGGIHVVSAMYVHATKTVYLKGDKFAEASLDVSLVVGSMTNAQVIRFGAAHVTTGIGLRGLFNGICVGANAQAYYDEIVTLPA